MTFREYWRVLGFGTLSTKTRAFAKYGLHREDDQTREIAEKNARIEDLMQRNLELSFKVHEGLMKLVESKREHLEYTAKLADSLMTKAGLQKISFKPNPPKESKPQPLTALDEMEADYDRVQAEDQKEMQQ